MITALSSANNAVEFWDRIPKALDVVREYRRRLLDGEVPVWDLIVTKHLSRAPQKYRQRLKKRFSPP